MFVFTYLFWLLSEILLNRLLHSDSGDHHGSDRNSLKWIWISILFSICLAVFFAMKVKWPIHSSPFIPYWGIALIWIGIVFRMLVIYSLGRFFTVDVTIRKDHQLKMNGFYRYIRHPSYSASLVSFCGFGIVHNNWLSFFIVVIPVLISFLYRIKVEEKLLIQQFGSAYLDYQKETYALVPFVY